VIHEVLPFAFFHHFHIGEVAFIVVTNSVHCSALMFTIESAQVKLYLVFRR
jgi:hypothetical protein